MHARRTYTQFITFKAVCLFQEKSAVISSRFELRPELEIRLQFPTDLKFSNSQIQRAAILDVLKSHSTAISIVELLQPDAKRLSKQAAIAFKSFDSSIEQAFDFRFDFVHSKSKFAALQPHSVRSPLSRLAIRLCTRLVWRDQAVINEFINKKKIRPMTQRLCVFVHSLTLVCD